VGAAVAFTETEKVHRLYLKRNTSLPTGGSSNTRDPEYKVIMKCVQRKVHDETDEMNETVV
jgi:hypothetical protein